MAIANLEVQLALQSAAFTAGIKEAQESLRGMKESISSLAESGHEIHSLLREVHNIALGFEVAKVGVEAFNAVTATMNGTAEEAAEGQRKLYESIKEIPIVGKLVAEAMAPMLQLARHN